MESFPQKEYQKDPSISLKVPEDKAQTLITNLPGTSGIADYRRRQVDPIKCFLKNIFDLSI